ncbi:MAG TPA: HEAT repeat domain-containing protein [Blastococcus sp.]|jgi:HEAT repeat protein|nr:HEAT repeat domain-containing protein [Blastococcus sp.]
MSVPTWFRIRRGRDTGSADRLQAALTREACRPHPDAHALTELLDALVALDAPGIEALLDALGGPDAAVRPVVAARLQRLRDPRTLGPLVVALRDKDDGVRAAAATAIAHLGDPRAADALARALDDASPAVRRIAAFALGERADRRAVPELVLIARVDPVTVAWEMVRWLGRSVHPLPGETEPPARSPSSAAVAAVLRPVVAQVPGLAPFVRSAADRSEFGLDGAGALALIQRDTA